MPPNATPDDKRRKFAIVGAGISGLVAARTLLQAGHEVTVFEKALKVGGRMASRETPFGSFDHGAQYFTVRDERFRVALDTTAQGACKRWSANAVRVLDPFGNVAEAALPRHESHWVATPTMDALPRLWARQMLEQQQPFGLSLSKPGPGLRQAQAERASLELGTRIQRIERDALDATRWQLRTQGADESVHVYSGFDAVLLAITGPQARALLEVSKLAPLFVEHLAKIEVAPCWTLMLAFPQALQPGLTHLGPQWNAALSTHHRIAWLARESSKPGRGPIERWTVQGSPAWSTEHFADDADRVRAKLLKAFSEVTGIRAEPAHADIKRWRHAKTLSPLGRSHLWDSRIGLGVCGDWCIGHRLEDAFVSGLELALDANGA